MNKTLATLAVLALPLMLAAPAGAQNIPPMSPNGVWRCSAQGNIPIGVMTISGTGYRFQVVSNTAWALKPADRGNGSGKLTLAPGKVTPGSGPLVAVYKARSGLHELYKSPRESYDFIDFYNDPAAAYLLRCYRPD